MHGLPPIKAATLAMLAPAWQARAFGRLARRSPNTSKTILSDSAKLILAYGRKAMFQEQLN
jgi:hypothetical protein